MQLIERDAFLTLMRKKFEGVAEGEGHSILLTGEAGIGKTSLMRTFCSGKKNDCNIYYGTCDALFTPRPLAPLYDIIQQMGGDVQADGTDVADRAGLFARVLHEL